MQSDPETKPFTTRPRFCLAMLFIVAALVRCGWVMVRYDVQGDAAALEYPDEHAYWLSARSLGAGDGLIDEFGYRATYMPGYPAFLSLFDSVFGARIVQALLGAWVASATYLLARQWFTLHARTAVTSPALVDRCALLAGLAAVFDPFLIFFSGLLLTETLFAAVLVSGWAMILRLCRRDDTLRWTHAVIAGVLMLVMLLLRPGSALVVAASPCVVLIACRFRGLAWRRAGVMVVVVILGLLPWVSRNHELTGKWVWLTTRGGISLYDGLQQGGSGASDLAHTKRVEEVAGLSEIEWDRYWHDKAMQACRDDPGHVLRMAGRKFLRTWSLTPNVANYRESKAAWVSLVWMAGVLFLAGVGWLRSITSFRAWGLLVLPVCLVTLQHMIFVGSVRYRIPSMPMLFVLAAYGLAGFLFRKTADEQSSKAIRS